MFIYFYGAFQLHRLTPNGIFNYLRSWKLFSYIESLLVF